MKTVSVRELKAHWAELEEKVRQGETFLILNRGRPSACLVPATPRDVVIWDDHLETAVKPVASARVAEEILRADRDGRW